MIEVVQLYGVQLWASGNEKTSFGHRGIDRYATGIRHSPVNK